MVKQLFIDTVGDIVGSLAGFEKIDIFAAVLQIADNLSGGKFEKFGDLCQERFEH